MPVFHKNFRSWCGKGGRWTLDHPVQHSDLHPWKRFVKWNKIQNSHVHQILTLTLLTQLISYYAVYTMQISLENIMITTSHTIRALSSWKPWNNTKSAYSCAASTHIKCIEKHFTALPASASISCWTKIKGSYFVGNSQCETATFYHFKIIL